LIFSRQTYYYFSSSIYFLCSSNYFMKYPLHFLNFGLLVPPSYLNLIYLQLARLDCLNCFHLLSGLSMAVRLICGQNHILNWLRNLKRRLNLDCLLSWTLEQNRDLVLNIVARLLAVFVNVCYELSPNYQHRKHY